MKFWRNKKIIIILVAVIIFSISGFEVARVARAAEGEESTIGGITSTAVYLAALATAFLAGKIAAALYTAIAGLLDIAIQANALLLSSPVVLSGWKIVLGFANLGFVLAIIIIAFATIFRQQNYAMKQTLWKLIVAALLVNFSLVIAGAFINVADNVTSSFSNKITSANVSTALTGLLKVQTFQETPWEKMSGTERIIRGALKIADTNALNILTGLSMEKAIYGDVQSAPALITGDKDLKSESMLVLVSAIFFSVLFTILSVLTLLAVAVMMFIRYFFLGILLILSPIVWLLWIFPATSSYWQKWWNNFLKWTFFAPIMMFFLYLAIATISVENLKESGLQGVIVEGSQATENLAKKQEGGLVVDIAKFGNLALVIGLIMSGLIAANSLSIYGAKVAMGAARGAAKGMGKGIARLPLRGGAAALKGTGLGSALGSAGTRWQRSANRFTRLAGKGLSGIAGGVNKASAYKIKKGQGVWASTWGGMKAGSGLFKKKQTLYTKTETGEYKEAGDYEKANELEKQKRKFPPKEKGGKKEPGQEEEPGIILANKYTKIPPPEERKG